MGKKKFAYVFRSLLRQLHRDSRNKISRRIVFLPETLVSQLFISNAEINRAISIISSDDKFFTASSCSGTITRVPFRRVQLCRLTNIMASFDPMVHPPHIRRLTSFPVVSWPHALRYSTREVLFRN